MVWRIGMIARGEACLGAAGGSVGTRDRFPEVTAKRRIYLRGL